jgi:hypothetical protein
MAKEIHEAIEITIPVGKEKWTLGSDKHNFILGKRILRKYKGDRTNVWEWDGHTTSFHSSLESCLIKAQQLMIKNTPIKTFEQLQASIKKSSEDLMGMYKMIKEGDFNVS